MMDNDEYEGVKFASKRDGGRELCLSSDTISIPEQEMINFCIENGVDFEKKDGKFIVYNQKWNDDHGRQNSKDRED